MQSSNHMLLWESAGVGGDRVSSARMNIYDFGELKPVSS